MSKVVIHVEGLGKSYHRGALQQSTLLRDHLGRMLKSPLSIFHPPKEETFWALKDVSLEVREGEVLGVIGRNGAGKSTLLKILSRITKPTTGWAEIHGRVGSLLEVGTGFHPELTGRENVFLNGAILGMRKQEIARKFDEIVAFAELEKFIDTPVKRYSSGMYVRLAFGVAAHLEPEILVVDEVLAVGDVAFQKKCLGKMTEFSSGGRTIIFVSHNLNAVSALCQSAMLLEKGRLSFHSNNVQEALRLYASPAVSTHTVNLSRHPNRVSRTSVFEEISISDEDRGATHCFAPGAKVLIQFKVKPRGIVRSPRMSIGVTSYRGERVFAIGTHLGGNVIPDIDGAATVSVHFVIPPLVPGQYSLDIGFYDRMGHPLDAIYGGACIEILKDDYLSLVDEHGPHSGHLMVRSEWTCSQNGHRESSEVSAHGLEPDPVFGEES
jgi:lipopolysaccharide transport system ATP-binding protein